MDDDFDHDDDDDDDDGDDYSKIGKLLLPLWLSLHTSQKGLKTVHLLFRLVFLYLLIEYFHLVFKPITFNVA